MAEPAEEYREIIGQHEALNLVGQIASSWAILEWQMDMTIWWLAGIEEPEGACITGQLFSIHPRMRAIIALTKLKNKPHELINRLNKFSADSETVVRLRNRAVHDPWYVGLASGQIAQHKITAEKELKMEMAPRTLDGLKTTLTEIHKLRRRFTDMMDALDYPTFE